MFRFRRDGSHRGGGNSYDGSFERKGYAHKKYDVDDNIQNDPKGKLFATLEGRFYGYDVVARVDPDQKAHPSWPEIEQKLVTAGAKLVEVRESDVNGWYDVIWYEDGEVLEKLDVGIRGDWQNPNEVIHQRDHNGNPDEKKINKRWLKCIGNDYFPYEDVNFWRRKFDKINCEDKPTLIVEYAFDGSRSYRIDYEKGEKIVPVVESKFNNKDDGSIKVPIGDVDFFKWQDGKLVPYVAEFMTKEIFQRINRAEFLAGSESRKRSN